MKHAVTIIAAATALLASCDQPAPTPKPVIKVQGDEQRQLAAASDMNRAIALKRAIYDGGATCKRVTATGFVTDYKNLAMWQAHCDDGKDWAIFIAANGSIRPEGTQAARVQGAGREKGGRHEARRLTSHRAINRTCGSRYNRRWRSSA